MYFKARILVVMIFAVALSAIAAERAMAADAWPSCCICFCGSQNASMMGTGSSDSLCTDLDTANSGQCNDICDSMGCVGKLAPVPCTDPALAEQCGIATMAPASSPTGLIALAVALSGVGAFWLRRRSLQS